MAYHHAIHLSNSIDHIVTTLGLRICVLGPSSCRERLLSAIHVTRGSSRQYYAALRTGGLAQALSVRVPDAFIEGIAAMGREYLSFGPAHHRGEQWDLVYLQFSFGDQLVEVGSDRNCGIREASSGEWHSKVLNFTRYQTLPVYGRRVRIMDKADLIAYKRILGREVDREDIRQLGGV